MYIPYLLHVHVYMYITYLFDDLLPTRFYVISDR